MSQASLRQFSSVCLWLLLRLLRESHAIVFGHKVFRILNFVMSNDYRTIHIWKHRGRMSSGLDSIYDITFNDDQYSCCQIVMGESGLCRTMSFAERFLRKSRSKTLFDRIWIWNRIETLILSFRLEKVLTLIVKSWKTHPEIFLKFSISGNKVMLKHVFTILNTSLIEYNSYLLLRNLMPSPELKTFPSKHFGLAQKLFLIYFLNFTFRRKSGGVNWGQTEARVRGMSSSSGWSLMECEFKSF